MKRKLRRKEKGILELIDGSKKVIIPNVKVLGFFGKGFGLMFSRREKARALLFEFDKQVDFHLTSLFVFFPFLVVWMDKNNNVLGKKIVMPWKITVSSSVKSYYKILEIPLNNFYSSFVKNLI